MKILALNGSARKSGNTAALLEAACEGARAAGAETELIDLYDVDFHGCRGCEACKRLGSPGFGSCAVRDGLSDILEKAKAALNEIGVNDFDRCEITLIPNEWVTVSDEDMPKIKAMLDELDEAEDVQTVYTNIENL